MKQSHRNNLLLPLPVSKITAAVLLTAAPVVSLFAVNIQDDKKSVIAVPKGLPEIEHPEDNTPSAAKIELGKQLFFDPRLSRDNTISCASCHDPKKGYSNGEAFATGVDGKVGGRSSPTIINSAYAYFHFWDGRAGSLEEQALGPIQNPIEMNLTLPEMEKKLNAISGYREQFKKVFGTSKITAKNVARAIAAFERTILSGDAPFDRYKAGDKKALSPAALRGKKLFFSKAHCSACHSGPNFTDRVFHNIGVGMDKKDFDKGREAISKMEGDRGAFKTPTLREIARTAPYMHDGSIKTLDEVVRFYNKGGIKNDWLDEEIFERKLTEKQISDLVIFLREGLSSSSYPLVAAPKLPE